MMYLPPATTLGSAAAAWILCVITGMSTVLPVSGSIVCGVWHRLQISMVFREPPCSPSETWQWLQVAVAISSRTTVTCRAAGHEVIGVVVVLRAHVELGQVPRAVHADRVGHVLVIVRRQFLDEGVGVDAFAYLSVHSCVFAGGLNRALAGDRRGLRAHRVGNVLTLTRGDPRKDEARRHGSRRLNPQPVQRQAARIGDRVPDFHSPVCCDLLPLYLEYQSGANEVNQCLVGVECLVPYRCKAAWSNSPTKRSRRPA